MTGYEKRYAGLKPHQCDREALLLMQEALNRTRLWEDVADRLIELRKVKSYAPEPARIETLHAPGGIECNIAPRRQA